VSVLSRRVAKQAWRSAVFASALAVGCAESAQEGKLDEATLTGAGTSGSGGSETAGSNATSGTGGGGAPGSAGTSGSSSTSGAAGMAGGGAGAGGTGGAGAGAGGGGAMNGGSGGGGVGGGGGTGGATNGFRYAKLVATSEQNGKVWSSCAELNLYTTGDQAISRAAWVVMADSQESDDQVAPSSAIKDGDANTFWHTEWEPGGVGDAALPHQLVIDTGVSQAITGFSYLPRQDSENGRIAGWEFYLSKDGTTWGTAVKTGTFPAGTDEQKISL
jgi:hypothetical protein